MVQIYSRVTRQIKGAKILKNYKGKKVLAFSPHSDDLSISAGGFLYNLSRKNQVIPVLGFTGWRGVVGRESKKKAILMREEEMRREASVLGLEEPVFLELRSYEKDDRGSSRKDGRVVRELIEKVRPDIVLVPNRRDT